MCENVINDDIENRNISQYTERADSPVEIFYEGKKPTSQLRYDTVINHLRHFDGEIKRIVEFGCAKMNLVEQLIFTHTDISHKLEEICLVDISRHRLENNLYKLRKIDEDRTENLTVNVYQGSIGKYDDCLKNTDAVIGIEIIEHLYENTLEALAYNIFGRVQPKIVILTTPNCEYNKILGIRGFRNNDHKFEWSRSEFNDYSLNICERFPYTFQMEHIGGNYSEENGAISQLVVFKLNYDLIKEIFVEESFGICSKNAIFRELKYKLLAQEIIKPLSRHKFVYKLITKYLENKQSNKNMHCNKMKLPIVDIVNSINEQSCYYKKDLLIVDEDEVKNVLEGSFFKLERLKVPRKGFQLCLIVHG